MAVRTESTQRVAPDEGYRRWSAHYDSQPNPMLSLEERYLSPLLPPIKDRDIVDLGCGTGRWLHTLESRSPRSLLGIDSSTEMLLQAAQKLGRSAVLLRGKCEDSLVDPKSADLIICSFVLSYVSDINRFARQLCCIARHDADIFITDLHPETERLLGWKRGFRDGKTSIEMEAHWRESDSISSAFKRHGLSPAAFLEPFFGEPEFEILRCAGKTDTIDGLRRYPPIYILQLKPMHVSGSRPRNITDHFHVGRLHGCRVAIGATEASQAAIEIEGGQIAALSSRAHHQSHSPITTPAIDLDGFLVLPGLINSHDHLEFALFPRLGHRKYVNFREWADDIYRPYDSPIREHRAVPKETRLWWGGIRNLLSGVTTVCHHNPYIPEVFENGFPVRVMRHFGWAHSIPIDPDFAKKHAASTREHPFILHLAEGTDDASAAELVELDRHGVLDERTVIVHGLALTAPQQISLFESRGAALIWCPSSNDFLFGQTHSAATIAALSRVSLGSDSSLTATGDLLDEIRFAHQNVGLNAGALYSQVTLSAAAVLRLDSGEGSLRPGAMADLIAIRDKGLTPAETLLISSYRDIELVILGGRVQLASHSMKSRLAPNLGAGLERLVIDGEIRWIRAPLARLFSDAERVLGPQLKMNGRLVSYDSAN